MNEERWLTDTEQRIWRQWLAVTMGLPAALDRQLHRDAGLSLQDFEVLVLLADEPESQLRMSQAAARLSRERTRLSHHVARMERRGLVRREGCDTDRRGAVLVLTETGREALESAAPGHVRTVRHLMFDALSPDDLDALDRLTALLQAQLAGDSPKA